ncbi:MAG: hypothetical protein FWG55_04305 [Candidatus Bathyarchaeota archaeon]|nr:hypothetical protein [Candidatus Termiticorpusculum sp.]
MSRTLANIGFILALIGSILLILAGIGAMFGIFFLIFFPAYALGAFFWGFAMFIIGILGAISSRFVHNIGAALWIILLAIIASLLGASFIAWIMVIGAIIGLLSRL